MLRRIIDIICWKRSRERYIAEGWRLAQNNAIAKRQQLARDELITLVGRPVICIGNEWETPVVGFVLEIDSVGQNYEPLPVVQDYVSGRAVMCFGHIKLYSDQLFNALVQLNPAERWVLVSDIRDSHEEYDPERKGVSMTESQLRQRLEESGFFRKWAEYRNLNA